LVWRQRAPFLPLPLRSRTGAWRTRGPTGFAMTGLLGTRCGDATPREPGRSSVRRAFSLLESRDPRCRSKIHEPIEVDLCTSARRGPSGPRWFCVRIVGPLGPWGGLRGHGRRGLLGAPCLR
jgi:hypothetical protein